MSERQQVTVPFAPRPWQRTLLDDRAKRIVAVVHRRAGKSTALMWMGLKRAMTEKKPNPRVVHILPYGVMWQRTGLWDQLAQAADAIPGAIVRRSELAIRLPNGGIFQCGGADNVDSWRGGGADLAIIDEFDDTPPSLVPLVIEPMLADRNGTLVRSGTPKGRGLLQAAYDRAKTTEGYSAYLLDYTRTGALNEEAVETLRREMSDEEFAQELECSFASPNSGSYYGKLMDQAEKDGRVAAVPHDPALKVWTAWDLGIDDSTAIWCVQLSRAGEWRFIDYIEDSGAGLDHYVRLLQQRPYVFEMHLLPHDAAVRELGSGKSRRETLHALGVRPTRIVRQHSVADGINAVRLVLPRAWFDAGRCVKGIQALRHYRREWNEAAQAWRSAPVHDHASHCFVGETKVLTRHGTYRIMDLPQSGEVLTPCGWKPYHSPRITRRNAPLVEVAFADGNTVRCTPDHMFLTASGWTSASDLQPTSQIRSSLTLLRSISAASSIAFGRVSGISRLPVSALIAWFGKQLSERYRAAVTFITETATSKITLCPTSNACLQASISLPLCAPLTRRTASSAERQTEPGSSTSRRMHEAALPSGTNQRKVGCGIVGTPDPQRTSAIRGVRNGRAWYAALASWLWGKTGIFRTNTAPKYARRGLGATVTVSRDAADVWCITVPGVECFSLANGAVVHNCADAARYLCLGVREEEPKPIERVAREPWEYAQPGSVGAEWMKL